jgi:hypothetical protein
MSALTMQKAVTPLGTANIMAVPGSSRSPSGRRGLLSSQFAGY